MVLIENNMQDTSIRHHVQNGHQHYIRARIKQ